MKQELLSKHKNKIINLIILLVAFNIAKSIYQKQMAAIAQVRDQVDAQVKNNEVLGEISAQEKKIGIYKDYLNSKKIDEVLRNISEFAQQCGLEVSSARPLPKQDSADYLVHTFQCNLVAKDYHAVGRFINLIESHPNVYTVEEFTLRYNETGEIALKGFPYDLAVRISTVFLKS